ncbi:MAG: tetratricopeptide repeat protein, partial [Prevotellaceae bacterium]|nr:tetratricopeptide repeat protein [Prevotellaceae bacterium]
GALTQKEREFYNQREFNSVVDDAHLLSGKASVYLQKYDQAINVFDYILTEYPKASAIPETKIWLAIALTYETESDRVIKLLQEAGENDKLSKANKSNIHAAYANYYIKQDDFGQAINELNLAIKNEPKKANKIRYYFILANLCERTGRAEESAQYLQKIIRATNDYEQELSASLLLAGAANNSNSQELKKNLHKMLKDPKNHDYADRIYFALAKVEKAVGNDTGAVRYLELTVQADSRNPRQAGLAYEMLGNYYYEQEFYPQAYDNLSQAAIVLGASYSRYEQIATRATSLKNLASNWQIVHREDSLQRIAKMSSAERDKFINDMIAQIIEKERQEAVAEQERMMAAYRIERERYTTTGNTNNKWYFYNTNSVNAGQGAFLARWGKRRLEDNWRRKDKTTSSFLIAEETSQDTTTTQVPLSNKSREYYLRDLPLTSEQMAASNNKLRPALFNLGEAYMNDVNLPNEAIHTFERLVEQFPNNNEFLVPTYYYLHNLYTNSGNQAKADRYKQLLVQQYPQSPVTQQLINPNYLTEQRVIQQRVDEIYSNALMAYNEGRYSEAIAITADINAQYPQNLIQPQIALLNAFCVAKTGSIGTYKQALTEVVGQYPSTEVALIAKELLTTLEENALKYDAPTSPVTTIEASTLTASTITSGYAFSDGKHYFALLFGNQENTGELIFIVETYNAEHFLEEDYEVSVNDLGNNYSILLVKGFESRQAATNYSAKLYNDRVLNQFSPPNFRTLLITPENYSLLLLSKDVIGYIEFFNIQYNR